MKRVGFFFVIVPPGIYAKLFRAGEHIESVGGGHWGMLILLLALVVRHHHMKGFGHQCHASAW